MDSWTIEQFESAVEEALKEKLEREKLKSENELLKAKTDNLASQKHVEELYENALRAMRSYGSGTIDEDDEYDV